ncbi:hypothetical protein I4U23_027348, partial [Adineta vaga]
MSSLISLLYLLILLSTIVNTLEINLDLTKWKNELINDNVIRHDCVHFPAWEKVKNIHEIITYCISELPSKWNIQINNFDQIFTFANLSQMNITSEQLYLWSAPMDIIEDYQFYLDQLSTSNQTTMSSSIYYNCTLPTFGPMCQYEFDSYESDQLSLGEIIYKSYLHLRYSDRDQTCYTHLQCNLGKTSLCIGWNNICDGIIQCINGVDEEHCWQLETNECKDNEFRCADGQCIPLIFFKDNADGPDCLDGSDEYAVFMEGNLNPIGPPFRYNDIICLKHNIITVGPFLDHCRDTYAVLFEKLILSDMSDLCSLALQCYFEISNPSQLNCVKICRRDTCKEKIEKICPPMFFMPNAPIAFGHIYFAYTKDYIMNQTESKMTPEYVCYNEQLCSEIYSNNKLISFNNTTCYRPIDLPFIFNNNLWVDNYVLYIQQTLSHCNTILRNDSTFCNKTTMYHCVNSSKCIAKIRLFDEINDCDYKDDELLTSINETSLTTHIKCTQSNTFISRKLVNDRIHDCKSDIYGIYDDEYSTLNYIREHLSFPTICDGIVDLKLILIDGNNHTDETECEQWSCNNTYTYCNGIWNCLNGADEVDCYPSLLMNCSSRSHLCLTPETGDFMCLSLNKTNNGHIDCLGASDEPQYCPRSAYSTNTNRFYCETERGPKCMHSLLDSNGKSQCLHEDDRKLCRQNGICYSLFGHSGKCSQTYRRILSDVEDVLCKLFKNIFEPKIIHFSLEVPEKSNHSKSILLNHRSTSLMTSKNEFLCHRGLDLRVWLNKNKNESITTCLCSPNYYGEQCEYQNERVSLSIQFQSYSDSWSTTFTIIITLIDDSNQRIIHSSQQFTYIPVPNCLTKYAVDLLHATRPKNPSRQYSVHIDVYEKVSLLYRGSLLIPLSFSFLPVQRVAAVLYIPHTNDVDYKSCSNRECLHGQCVQYFNDPKNTTFCHCHHGWSGQFCNISYSCKCSSDSLCLGILPNNRSICVCPINKWGSRCLLNDVICQSNMICKHEGQCIPLDRNLVEKKQFECICKNGYYGERCELKSNEILLSFHKNIILPQSMFIHFIEIKENALPGIGMTVKSISMYQKSFTIRWSRPFHIAFLEFYPNIYYLIIVQKNSNRLKSTEKIITSTDLCPHLREVLNETFARLHLLRRIKYYHKVCQNHSSYLSCFYDDGNNNTVGHFCLCNDFDDERQANCFEFNHNKNFDCQGRSNCEHGGQCFQDSSTCPSISLCVCPLCYSGSRCQFSSNGFSFSLDSIL